jgi:hypothetical protein
VFLQERRGATIIENNCVAGTSTQLFDYVTAITGHFKKSY